MNQSLDLSSIGSTLTKFLRRYHGVIFFAFLGGGLAICMFVIISIIGASSVVDSSLITPVNTTFDQKTIDRVSELQSGSTSESLTIPKNVRTNPFED